MGRRSSEDPEAFALLVGDLYEAAGVLRRHGERIAASAGQTQARWQLMSVLSVGNWTVPMAADRLGTSRQAVQRIANELVDEGLAVFDENPRHRRSPFLRLSDQGRGVLETITAEAGRRNRDLANIASVDPVETRVALGKLTAAVRALLDDGGDGLPQGRPVQSGRG